MSSAKSKSARSQSLYLLDFALHRIMPLLFSSSDFLRTQSINIPNNSGDHIHPCLTPVSIVNQSLFLSSTFTQHSALPYVFLIRLIILPGIPYASNVFHKDGLSTLSKKITEASHSSLYQVNYLEWFSSIE